MIHALKTWPEFFQAVKCGEKTFEIRKTDRPYDIGDFLELHEWNPDTEQFTNEEPIMVEVTYLMNDQQFVAWGMVCMAIRQCRMPTSEEAQRAIEYLTNLSESQLHKADKSKFNYQFRDEADYKKMAELNTVAITALRQMQEPTSDEILWQEIFSLREKLKIAVEAIKSYEPEFDDKLFLHQLNSVDYEQLMEEFTGSEQKEPLKWIFYSGERWDEKKYRYFRCPKCRRATAIRSPFCPECGKKIGEQT